MIHYLYVGHFQHDGSFIRLAKSPTEHRWEPVTLRPIDLAVVEDLLNEKGTRLSAIPEDWHLWFEDQYLVCDKYTRSRNAIDFLMELANRTGCDIVDYSAQVRIRPEELAYQWDRQPAERVAGVKRE